MRTINKESAMESLRVKSLKSSIAFVEIPSTVCKALIKHPIKTIKCNSGAIQGEHIHNLLSSL